MDTFRVAFCDDDILNTEIIMNETKSRFALLGEEISFYYYNSGKDLLQSLEKKEMHC